MPPFGSDAEWYRRKEKPVPYAFRHEMKLTNDVGLFKDAVHRAPLTANVDSPESGMDALLQAITCNENIIGWRTEV